MAATVIKLIQCSCKHEYQDKKYGSGMRVHNYSPKKKAWSCTVCSNDKSE